MQQAPPRTFSQQAPAQPVYGAQSLRPDASRPTYPQNYPQAPQPYAPAVPVQQPKSSASYLIMYAVIGGIGLTIIIFLAFLLAGAFSD